MSFEVDQQVTPTASITVSGFTTEVVGIAGTVVSRQLIGVFNEESRYRYQVVLETPVLFGEGDSVISGSVFWFSEEELGGASITASSSFDINTITQTLESGKGTVENSAGVIDQILSQVPTSSPFYDQITGLNNLVVKDRDLLRTKSAPNTPKTADSQGDYYTGRESAKLGETLALNAQIFQEVSENLFGIYTIVSEEESEFKSQSNQAKVQSQLAMEDDALNQEAYFDNFILNVENSNILSNISESSPLLLEEEDTTDIDKVNPDLIFDKDSLKLEQS